MLAALIIVFRETMEAGLVVGIVLGATRGVFHRGRYVAYGITTGLIGACIVAAFASRISAAMSGNGQEVMNAGILCLAVLMLTVHNVWMARHGRQMASEMRQVGADVSEGRKTLVALAVVVGIAVLREGSETVLFLYGVAVSALDSGWSMTAGGAIGLVLAVGVTAVTYFGFAKIPSKRLFKVTSWLIALLAAGMASQAVLFLSQAGVVNSLSQTVWNSSGILPDSSLAGRALHTLIGYTDRPSLMQILVYGATVAAIFTLMKIFDGQKVIPKTISNSNIHHFPSPESPEIPRRNQARG